MPIIPEQDAYALASRFDELTEEQRPKALNILTRYRDQQDELGLSHWPSKDAARQKSTERYRSMFADLKKVDELAPSFTEILPYSDNPDGDRARVANINFLAREYGKPVQEVGEMLPLYQQDYLTKAGLKTDMDDLGFYSVAKAKVDKDVKAETSQNDALNAGAMAGLGGKSIMEAVSGWLQGEGAAQSDKKDAVGHFMRAYQHTAAGYVQNAGLINELTSVLERTMKGDVLVMSESDKAAVNGAVEKLVDMPGTQRRQAIAAIQLEAQRRGQGVGEEKGFFQGFGESFRRLLRAGDGSGQVTISSRGFMGLPLDETFLAKVPEKGVVNYGGKLETEQDARAYVSEWLNRGGIFAPEREASDRGGSPTPRYFPDRELTPEQSELIRKAKDREERKLRVIREVESAAIATDPVTGTASNVFGSTGAMLFLSAGTGPLALPILSQGYSNLEYNQMRREYPMMEPSDAKNITALSGLAMASLDKIHIGVLKGLPSLTGLFKNGIVKETAKRVGRSFLRSHLAETGIETAQDFSTPLIHSAFAALRKDMPGRDWDKEESFMTRLKENGIALLPLSLVGTGVMTFAEYNGLHSLQSWNTMFGAAGVIESDRIAMSEAIQAGDTQKADALLKDAWTRRDPAVAAEFGGRLAANDIQAQQAFEEASRIGLLPQIRRDGEGYVISDAQGNTSRFADWNQAREVAVQHMNEQERQNINAVAAMADHFIATTPGFLQAGESFDIKPGETTLLKSRVSSGEMGVEEAVEAAIVAGELAGMTREESMKLNFAILGSNIVEQKEGIRQSVSRIQRGGNALTVVEEGVEGRWKAGLQSGVWTKEMGVLWVRTAEQVTGEKFLPGEGEVSDRQLVEAISKVVVADVFGRRKDGTRLAPGVVTSGIKAATKLQGDVVGLAAFLRAFRALFGQILRVARAISKARKDGKLSPEWEAQMDNLLGVDSQQRYEREVETEGEALADEWVDEGEFDGYVNQTTDDATFSLQRVVPPVNYPATAQKVVATTNVPSLTKALLKPGEKLVPLDDSKAKPMLVSPAYKAAKREGNLQAAWDIAKHFTSGKRLAEFEQILRGKKPLFVPLQQREGERVNLLPVMFSHVLAERLGGRVADDVHQIKLGGNTGARADARGNKEHEFVGELKVEAGETVVLVDDTFTSGNTLTALYDYLVGQRVQPEMFFTMATGRYTKDMAAPAERQAAALDKVGLDTVAFERATGLTISAYTGAELQGYILNGTPGIQGFLDRFHEGRDAGGARVGDGTTEEGTTGNGVTHSLRAIRPGEAIDRALSQRLAAPEQRITFFARARDRLARLSLDSLTWRGDLIEGTDSMEQRDAAITSLENERRFRQRARQRELRDDGMDSLQPGILATYARDLTTLEDHPLVKAMLNDHGKLMSRTTAEKQGRLKADGKGNAGDYDGAPWLPPQWFSTGSGIMPDVMAQNLYDDGLLNAATPDALWSALSGVITGTRGMNEAIREAKAAVRKVEQDAFRQSTDEANQWFNNAVQDIPTNHEKMMAAFRTMDAILSAFPAEVRGKVGGYTKLASLKSDKARLKHMLDRIQKLDVELEKHLQEEIREDLEKLFDKAQPTGGKGEKAGGKIGVEGHRVFKTVSGMVDLSADDVTKRIEELNTAIETETDLRKIGDMLEQQQLLELFGGLNAKREDKSWLKSAAELEAAWNFAAEFYATGRNKWKAQMEARLAEVADLRKQHIAAMGGHGTDARLAAIRAEAGKNDGTGLSLLSLVQVLERAYGTTHPLVRRWYGAARKATAAKGDAILGFRRDFADLLKAAMPESSSIQREQAVFDLKTKTTVVAPKVEGVSVKAVDIPLETAVKLVTGEADLKAFGLEDHHRDELQAALDEHQTVGSSRDSVTVQVVESTGVQSDVPLTPMQAVHITMLWAQEMYRPGMERHGWTQETIDAIEGQLPPLAVQIRGFLASKYDVGYDSMNRIYQRMYGIDLPRVANYAPGTFMHEGQEIDSDPFGQGLIQNGGVRAGFVRQRKQHMARPKWDSDALSLFFSHTANVEHWKAFAELGREMRGVLLSAESKAATEAQKGKAMESILGKWVEIIERGGLETARQATALDNLARRIGSNRSIIALAYNLGTLMKQSTALFGAMIRMPVAAYGRGFMRLFAGRLPVRDIFNQDFIQRRIKSGYSPEARAAMAQLWDAPSSRRRHLLQQGMELIGFVDGIFTTGTAAIAYDHHFRQGIQAGLTPEQARGEALAAAEDVVSRVAQPSETIDRSAFEIGAGAWGRLGFMFASDARQKWALLQEAVINRKEDPATLRRVLAFHLASGIALQTISAAWRDARDKDDDEMFDPKNWNPWSFLGGVVLGPFGGIPLLSSALDTFSGRGELIEAAASVKDIATGKGDMKDVATSLSGLAYLGTLGKYEDAAAFLAVSAKVAKDVLGLSENALE